MSQKDLDQAAYEPTLLTSTVQPSPSVKLCLFLPLFPVTLALCFSSIPPPLSATPTLWFLPKFPSLSLSLSSSPVLPPCRAPSDEGQDAVDEQGHDGGAEQASHGHCDKPRQEDVPEEAPVHRFLGADPTHGHDWAHLEAAARREERPQSAAAQKWNVTSGKVKNAVKSCRLFRLSYIYIKNDKR